MFIIIYMYIESMYTLVILFPELVALKGCMKIVRERRKDLLHKTSLQVFVYCGLPSLSILYSSKNTITYSQTMSSHTIFEQICINQEKY